MSTTTALPTQVFHLNNSPLTLADLMVIITVLNSEGGIIIIGHPTNPDSQLSSVINLAMELVALTGAVPVKDKDKEVKP